MTGIEDLLQRAAGDVRPPAADDVAADVARGRRALGRRRALAGGGSALTVVAVVAVAVAMAGGPARSGGDEVASGAASTGSATGSPTGSPTASATGAGVAPSSSGRPVVPGGEAVTLSYETGTVTWPANREGLPWTAPGRVVEGASPALVAAVAAHLDPARARAPQTELTTAVKGGTATAQADWRWVAGEGEGTVTVLASRGLLLPEADKDPHSGWPEQKQYTVRLPCTVDRSGSDPVLLCTIQRLGINADVTDRVAFTVRQDGTMVRVAASTQSDRAGEVGGVPPQLSSPPLTDEQLVAIALDPRVTVTVTR